MLVEFALFCWRMELDEWRCVKLSSVCLKPVRHYSGMLPDALGNRSHVDCWNCYSNRFCMESINMATMNTSGRVVFRAVQPPISCYAQCGLDRFYHPFFFVILVSLFWEQYNHPPLIVHGVVWTNFIHPVFLRWIFVHFRCFTFWTVSRSLIKYCSGVHGFTLSMPSSVQFYACPWFLICESTTSVSIVLFIFMDFFF
jgi:hypothetical protein